MGLSCVYGLSRCYNGLGLQTSGPYYLNAHGTQLPLMTGLNITVLTMSPNSLIEVTSATIRIIGRVLSYK